MSSSQLQDSCLHLKTIQIDDTRRAATKFKIVFKHESGLVQRFDTPDNTRPVNWECNIYVDLKTIAVLTIRREGVRGILKPTEFKPDFNTDEFGEHKTIERRGNELIVKMMFGTSIAGLDIARIRAEDAKNALESKKEVISRLDLFVSRLDLVVQLGTGPALLHPAAQISASVVSVILKNVQDIPNAHREFTDVIRDMDSILPTIDVALKRFGEDHVQNFLKEFVKLVSETSREVCKCYSSRKRDLLWESSGRDEIMALKGNVDRLKANIGVALNVDMKGDHVEMQEILAALRLQQLSDADQEILDLLEPPEDISYDTKDCCQVGTRTSVIQGIKTWAVSKDTSSRLYWLCGVAGSGKSSVATSIADDLYKDELLSGSFFCKRDITERRRSDRFIRTQAYCLAKACEPFSKVLLPKLKKDRSILKKPFSMQFRDLIAAPLRKVSTDDIHAPIILVVDALDECDDNGAISSFLAEMVNVAPWLRLIVTSRPTEEIRNGLSKAQAFMTELDLFAQNSRDDILAYIQFEFSPDGSLSILQSEISTDEVERLVDKAQGLFIWIATVLRYAGDPSTVGKVGIIDKILSSESASSPEAELDALYLQVLTSVTGSSSSKTHLVRLLLGLLLVTSRNKQLPAAAFHAFLPSESRLLRTEVMDILKKFGAVLTEDAKTGGIHVLHPSFLDFIGNESRSKLFWTEPAHLETLMGAACLDVMNKGLKFNICHLESSYHANSNVEDLKDRVAENISQELQYSSLYWLDHLSRSKIDSKSQLIPQNTSHEPVRQMLRDFLCTSLSLYWLETMSLMDKLGAASLILQQLSVHHKMVLDDAAVRDAANELRRFVSLFHAPIAYSIPHIYVSAMLWAPSETMISREQHDKLIRSEALVVGRAEYYPSNLQILRLDSSVQCVAFSPDGMRIVSGSGDNTIRIWDAETGAPIGDALQGHDGSVLSVTYSPDGSQIVSGSDDGTIRIWDAQIGAPVGDALQGHDGTVYSVAYSPNGSRIVSGSRDETIRIWDAQTGAPISDALQGHDGWVRSVAYSLDGSRIVSGSDDKTIRIWDAQTGTPIGDALRGHDDTVYSVVYSPDGSRIVSGSIDQTIRIWDAQTGAPVGDALRGHDDWVRSVTYSPDGSRIVSGSVDKTIRIWDAQTGVPIGDALRGHDDWVSSVAYAPDGSRVVSGSGDGTIRIWDAETGAPVGDALQGHDEDVYSVAYSPDGSRIVSGSDDKTIRIWDAQTGAPTSDALKGHDRLVCSVAYSPDGSRIVSGSGDHTIRIWDTQTGAPVGESSRGQSRWNPEGKNFIVFTETDATAESRDNHSIACSNIPLSIPVDGWIRTLDGGLLLWVPHEYRIGICDMSLFSMPRNAVHHPVKVDWKSLCHGSDWTKAWEEVRER